MAARQDVGSAASSSSPLQRQQQRQQQRRRGRLVAAYSLTTAAGFLLLGCTASSCLGGVEARAPAGAASQPPRGALAFQPPRQQQQQQKQEEEGETPLPLWLGRRRGGGGGGSGWRVAREERLRALLGRRGGVVQTDDDDDEEEDDEEEEDGDGDDDDDDPPSLSRAAAAFADLDFSLGLDEEDGGLPPRRGRVPSLGDLGNLDGDGEEKAEEKDEEGEDEVATAPVLSASTSRSSTSSSSSSSSSAAAAPSAAEEEGAAAGGARNRTAEWEAEAAWLTNQVLLYQTHLALSADALGSRHAAVGATPFDLGLHGGEKYRPPLEIAEATEEATYECRIHGEVEPGSKVVAPCRCRGTAKWMWFADMNRRRRRDPVASRTCGTCHAVIDYAAYQKFGSVVCKAVSWPLDHPGVARLAIGAGVVTASLLAALPLSVVVIRLLTSGLFWKQHSLWSRVIYGPLPLKIVLYRYVAQLAWTYFLHLEALAKEWLAEAESVLLERALPVTYPPNPQKAAVQEGG